MKRAFAIVSELKNSLAEQLTASWTYALLFQATVIHLSHFQSVIFVVLRSKFFVFDFLIDFRGVFANECGHIIKYITRFCLNLFKPAAFLV